ncbi:MAG: UDP-N-acetylglucosamine 1-carboxyvinyltransferase [Proteobacteria bacterium]|nr:MAG: UDP-N-acetylglucosamine 1-carboxyvinyltransferase [Pseudomonadota bacterium]HAF88877.1 UDP-N-acetylglucosamine 1-carboxyvinyltransferase [Deltaproteobacteria bacterium]|tara:strand:+ start:1357 stop:2643 length:1287 start_codon:yes stop_codon:yes gene_type:complete
MQKFIVEGGFPLSGSITPSGNKNEALPVLAASLLAHEPVTIRNVPDILDIAIMRNLLVSLGVKIKQIDKHSFRIDSNHLRATILESEQAKLIRGSFLLAGPLLARRKSIDLPAPGGDRIGLRPVHTHLEALEKLGAEITLNENGLYQMRSNGFKGTAIYLDEASVMATENAVMAAVTAEGKTSIYNAACEPHVQGLCHFLVILGASIQGIGSNLLIIEGVQKLRGGEYTIQSDHTEVGSFIGLAAVTGSELRIKNAGVKYLRMTRLMFEKLGVEIKIEGNDLLIPKKQKLTVKKDITGGIPKIDDSPWPGFPADLTSIITVVATQCSGAVLIFEKMFESRLFWVDKLIEMGAQIILCDPHRAVVSGPTQLKGARVSSPDIRAGMALLIAALGAKGTTEIQNIDQIDRGYENIEQRLNDLGAKIQRVIE